MAKKSAVERNNNRAKKVAKFSAKRARLAAIARDKTASPEERFQAALKLAELPRNSAKIRLRNRCQVSGRPRAYYRKFGISRIALRDLASIGQLPGVTKSSW